MADILNPNEPADKIKNPVPIHNTPDKPNNEPAFGVRTGVGTLNAHEENHGTAEAEEKRRQRRKDTREWGAILIAIAALCVSFGSCYGSNRSADTAERVLRTNIENSRLDQRAWIGVKQMLLSQVPTMNAQLIVNITLSNTGKTPALHVVSRIKFASEKPQSLESFSFTPPKVQSRVSPPNGYEYSTVLILLNDPLSGLLNEQQVASIKSGEFSLYAYGTITYEDVFGEPYLTRLCGIYTYNAVSLTAFQWCEEKDYNYME